MPKNGDTYKKILLSAEKVFAEKGYDGAGMREIADTAKVNKAMLFYYFKSKEKLYFAIITEAHKEMNEKISKVVNLAASAGDKIQKLAEIFTNLLFQRQDLFKIALREMTEFKQKPKFSGRDHVKSTIDSMAKIINEGIENKEFREVDPLTATFAFFGFIKTLFALQFFIDKKLSQNEIVKQSCDLILNGIKRG